MLPTTTDLYSRKHRSQKGTLCNNGARLPTTMSRADASNISRNNNFRNHSDPERPPKSWDREDPKVCTTIEHDRFLPALMQMVTADRLRGLHYNFMFENPKASFSTPTAIYATQ